MMRVAHVVSAMSWRGGEQQVAYLYEELAKTEIEQVIICRPGSVMEAKCRENDWNHEVQKVRFSADPIFGRKLARICREKSIDILHPHDSKSHTLCVLSVDWFKNKSAIVLERRVDFPVSNSALSRYKYRHPSIKKIICVSEAVRKILSRDIHHPELLTVVHDGIDLSRFESAPEKDIRKVFALQPKLPVIGNIAALSQQKDYFTFLDTVRILIDSGLEANYIVFGDGPQKEELFAYAREIGVFDKVYFAGFRKDITSFIPQLDILLFTSETEGLGSTILDCFLAGVPVVSTNAGGIPEILEHEVNGYMGRVKDPQSLADGVLFALENPQQVEKWKSNAREKVNEFSRVETAKKTRAVYEEVKAAEKINFAAK